MTKITNEIRILTEFIVEFNPFYTKEMVKDLSYDELISIVKEITEEM